MWIDTRADSEGESLSRAVVAVSITFMGHFFWVPFGQSFWFAWFTVHIWYISRFSHVCTHISSPRQILLKGHMGREHPLTQLSFGLQGACLYMCGWGGLLTLRVRNMTQPLPLIVLLLSSWKFQSIQNESPIALSWGAHLPPVSGLPDHLTYLLRSLYVGQGATVRTRHGKTFWFQIGKGMTRLYIVILLIQLICRVHPAKCWTGWITSWNEDCQKK